MDRKAAFMEEMGSRTGRNHGKGGGDESPGGRGWKRGGGHARTLVSIGNEIYGMFGEVSPAPFLFWLLFI